jgi:F420-dependent oxidoreductase-like protein
MRFGFKVRLQGASWQELLDVWRAADQSDLFESGWTYDHFVGLNASGDTVVLDHDTPSLDGWTALTAMAVLTRRLRLGTLVTGIHFRHPVVLTKMASTVDVISGGRLELGLGAGWLDEECEVFGFEPLGQPAERTDRLREAIDVITGLMTQDHFSYAGRHYRLRHASSQPHPVQRPHPPLWIGGNGERRTLPLVASVAQAWNYTSLRPGAQLEDFRHKRGVLHRECQRIGRPPEEVTVSVQLAAGDDPQAFAAEVGAWGEAGAEYVIVALPLPHRPAQIESLHEALLPLASAVDRASPS